MVTATVQNKPPVGLRLMNKFINPFMEGLLRSPLHFMVSRMYLLLTFTGRKSGKIYATPVQYIREGTTIYIITSEGYTWWKNLRDGATVQLVLRGKTVEGYATTSTDAQTLTTLMQKIYPSMSEVQLTRFVLGKVAITITMSNQKEV